KASASMPPYSPPMIIGTSPATATIETAKVLPVSSKTCSITVTTVSWPPSPARVEPSHSFAKALLAGKGRRSRRAEPEVGGTAGAEVATRRLTVPDLGAGHPPSTSRAPAGPPRGGDRGPWGGELPAVRSGVQVVVQQAVAHRGGERGRHRQAGDECGLEGVVDVRLARPGHALRRVARIELVEP